MPFLPSVPECVPCVPFVPSVSKLMPYVLVQKKCWDCLKFVVLPSFCPVSGFFRGEGSPPSQAVDSASLPTAFRASVARLSKVFDTFDTQEARGRAPAKHALFGARSAPMTGIST